MASSVLRSISRQKTDVNPPNFLRGVSNFATNSPKKSLLRGVIDWGRNSPINTLLRRGRSDDDPQTIVSNDDATSRISSPLLMLPPDLQGFDNDTMFYKFYSPAHDEILSLSRKRLEILEGDVEFKYVSSSHGWIVLFNRRNHDLFLLNPLSDRLVKLPPIHTLDIPQLNLKTGFQCISKVITSCSPDRDDCRVMMSYGPYRELAFCTPTSTTWTPITTTQHDHRLTRRYTDFVYSNKQKLFYCTTQWEDLEAWDLQDTECPKATPIEFSLERMKYSCFEDDYTPESDSDSECSKYGPYTYPWKARTLNEFRLKKLGATMVFLVVEQESGNLYRVTRHVGPRDTTRKDPYITAGFDVHKYDPEKGVMEYMDYTLNGLALFIGNNHSFAVRAKEYSLKRNSIYYTDVNVFIPPKWQRMPYGGHDVGIFNYQELEFYDCYYPNEKNIKRVIPAPMWFTPAN